MVDKFKLLGEIEIDKQKADDALASLESAGRTVLTTFTALAAAGTAFAAGLLKLTTDSTTATIELDRMSRQLGISIEQLSAQRYAFQQAGIEIDIYRDLIVTLSERMVEAARGSGTLNEFMGDLNITLDDLNKLNAHEALDLILERVEKLNDPVLRQSILSEVLGDQGALLGGISTAELKRFRQEAVDRGLILNDEDVRVAKEYQETLIRLQGQFDALKQNIVTNIGPILTEYLDQFSGWFEDNEDTIETVLINITTLFADLAEKIPAAFEWLVENRDTIAGSILGIGTAWLAVRNAATVAALAQLAASNKVLAVGLLGAAGFAALTELFPDETRAIAGTGAGFLDRVTGPNIGGDWQERVEGFLTDEAGGARGIVSAIASMLDDAIGAIGGGFLGLDVFEGVGDFLTTDRDTRANNRDNLSARTSRAIREGVVASRGGGGGGGGDGDIDTSEIEEGFPNLQFALNDLDSDIRTLDQTIVRNIMALEENNRQIERTLTPEEIDRLFNVQTARRPGATPAEIRAFNLEQSNRRSEIARLEGEDQAFEDEFGYRRPNARLARLRDELANAESPTPGGFGGNPLARPAGVPEAVWNQMTISQRFDYIETNFPARFASIDPTNPDSPFFGSHLGGRPRVNRDGELYALNESGRIEQILGDKSAELVELETQTSEIKGMREDWQLYFNRAKTDITTDQLTDIRLAGGLQNYDLSHLERDRQQEIAEAANL